MTTSTNDTNSESVDQTIKEGRWTQFLTSMFARVDIASLVYFRIVFGLIMLWEVIRYFDHNWIERYYIEPVFFFKYYGFDWLHPLPGGLMYLHFLALGLLSVCIMIGWHYRLATALFFLGFTYTFLLDQTNYLNHVYLISLISFLLIFLPANRAVSLDAARRPDIKTDTTPLWTVWLLRAQLAIPYVYGGIAKLNGDWLQCEPMRQWLADRSDFPLLGPLFVEEWVVHLFAYGGLFFDLLIVPMLLIPRLRWVGVSLLLGFHLMNSQLFTIGIFPWFMIFATPVFFPPHWCRAWLRWFGVEIRTVVESAPRVGQLSSLQRAGFAAITLFLLVQVLMPFRHWLYPGSPNWTEEGHRFAWHMKLRDKEATAVFRVADPKSRKSWVVYPEAFLTSRQQRKMPTHPDMVLQFCHFLADRWQEGGYDEVEVRAAVYASLNGRRPQFLVDPEVDLSKEARTLAPCDWIVALKEPLQVGEETRIVDKPASGDQQTRSVEIDDEQNRVANR